MRRAILLLAVGCLALASCERPAAFDRADLIGKWKAINRDKTVEFRADGTMTVVQDGVPHDRRYELRDGRTIVFEIKPDSPGTEMEWGVRHLDADRLVLTNWDSETGTEYRRQPTGK